MGAYDQFDRRLETLVMEEQTLFDDELQSLSEDDQKWIAQALHAEPHRAVSVHYLRHHTGFSRIIEATRADVERLYRERILKSPASTSRR